MSEACYYCLHVAYRVIYYVGQRDNSKGRCSMMRFLKLDQPAPGLAWRILRKAVSAVLVGLVLILSLFAGTIISSIFLHAVEF
jgi:hypothetical protein